MAVGFVFRGAGHLYKGSRVGRKAPTFLAKPKPQRTQLGPYLERKVPSKPAFNMTNPSGGGLIKRPMGGAPTANTGVARPTGGGGPPSKGLYGGQKQVPRLPHKGGSVAKGAPPVAKGGSRSRTAMKAAGVGIGVGLMHGSGDGGSDMAPQTRSGDGGWKNWGKMSVDIGVMAPGPIRAKTGSPNSPFSLSRDASGHLRVNRRSGVSAAPTAKGGTAKAGTLKSGVGKKSMPRSGMSMPSTPRTALRPTHHLPYIANEGGGTHTYGAVYVPNTAKSISSKNPQVYLDPRTPIKGYRGGAHPKRFGGQHMLAPAPIQSMKTTFASGRGDFAYDVQAGKGKSWRGSYEQAIQTRMARDARRGQYGTYRIKFKDKKSR